MTKNLTEKKLIRSWLLKDAPCFKPMHHPLLHFQPVWVCSFVLYTVGNAGAETTTKLCHPIVHDLLGSGLENLNANKSRTHAPKHLNHSDKKKKNDLRDTYICRHI